jgi:hypothetical protein
MEQRRLDRRPPGAPPAGALGRAVLLVERVTKETLWDCRMCGQCILHSTGLSCPMRCPKNLRNGPCGGVPDVACVWVLAWRRSRALPLWRDHMQHIQTPMDWRLQETSSWENFFSRRDAHVPAGWRDPEHAEERAR